MKDLLIPVTDKLQQLLDKRKKDSLYRSLQVHDSLIDFCSNDYLGFARSEKIKRSVAEKYSQADHLSGSTGSRSISGNTNFIEELEKQIAAFHSAETGLIFNSGYDANLGLFSCIAQKGDTIICDELIHASIIDGCRLSHASRLRFAHNNLADLEKKLQSTSGQVFVAVESVYSMDGDQAPLKEILRLCEHYNAALIVDEAHATGVFGANGKGLVNRFDLEKNVFARVHTFGKAMGGHGAIVLGSQTLRNYLINFSRSFIFTTALPVHSLLHIEAVYKEIGSPKFDNSALHILISHFREHFPKFNNDCYLIDSISPVQCFVIPGNERARFVATLLQENGFDVRAILSPSVPKGKERLRISLHLHNTKEQLNLLFSTLKEILNHG
ncbi:MAG: 8-amino-7-oxononanoate synthase [Bacteroidia bacterium]|nr:8-amino-7-oxononanoate synthase [Bacteroidia bacterium]